MHDENDNNLSENNPKNAYDWKQVKSSFGKMSELNKKNGGIANCITK